jgi:hypothetical protein
MNEGMRLSVGSITETDTVYLSVTKDSSSTRILSEAAMLAWVCHGHYWKEGWRARRNEIMCLWYSQNGGYENYYPLTCNIWSPMQVDRRFEGTYISLLAFCFMMESYLNYFCSLKKVANSYKKPVEFFLTTMCYIAENITFHNAI